MPTPGTHLELELRYVAGEPIGVPAALGPLRLNERRAVATHVDHYFDTSTKKLGGRLRKSGASLRLRAREDGSCLTTFKEKLPDGPAGETRRRETEAELCSLELDPTAAPVRRALEIAGDRPLRHLFSVTNSRRNSHYRGAWGEVVLSEDSLVYPDGERELRVELELVSGPAELLEICGRELEQLHPDLARARCGKRSQACRRLRLAASA